MCKSKGAARNSIGLGAASYKSVVLPGVGAGQPRLPSLAVQFTLADRDVFGWVLRVIPSVSGQGELRVHRKRVWLAPKGWWGIALLASQTYNVITMLILDGTINANHAEKNW